MASRTYKTEGIIIKRINYGEADKILTVFTREHGKVAVLAKGIRKLTSRKKGNLELFNRSLLYIARGKALDIIAETEIIDFFPQNEVGFEKLGKIYYLAEVIDRLVPEKVPERKIYEMFTNFIKNEKNLNDILKEILVHLGFIDNARKNTNFDVENFIENLIERKISSKKMMG